MRILVSRTDGLGDVALTLPICGWLKENIQGATVEFLGSPITRDIVEACTSVDDFHAWADGALPRADTVIHVFPVKAIAVQAKKSGIPRRIGTSHRTFHWTTCNSMVSFSRKNSDLHESQLNFQLLKPLGLKAIPSFEEVNGYLHMKRLPAPGGFLKDRMKNIIFHMKSVGAPVWPAANYVALANKLKEENCNIILTGTGKEKEELMKEVPELFSMPNVTDAVGKTSLKEMIGLIAEADALIACSTGPLHIAGLMDVPCIGFFRSKPPDHPGRWKPLGKNSHYIVSSDYDSDFIQIDLQSIYNKLRDIIAFR